LPLCRFQGRQLGLCINNAFFGIIGAADAFDAMTNQRPYNKPLSFNKALEKCLSLKRKQFDPDVIDALIRFVQKFKKRVRDSHLGLRQQNLNPQRNTAQQYSPLPWRLSVW
jgi:HD-GYP domain-containing protein (c-di-GMP phosphodiesterase class II)